MSKKAVIKDAGVCVATVGYKNLNEKGFQPMVLLTSDEEGVVSLFPGPKWGEFNQRERKRILLAVAYIEQHYPEKISQEGLSLEVKLGILKLQKGLRLATRYSIYGYQEQVRIRAAKELLASTDLPLSKIAKNVGFKTHSHFGEVFKRLIGLAPLQYRNCYGC